MTTDQFKIYVDRLDEGKEEKIEISPDISFLDLAADELTFEEPIQISGKTYISNTHLIIQLRINLVARQPCCICNEQAQININVKNFYLTEEIAKISGSVYDYREKLREAIILEVPQFIECGGDCPQRKELKQYLGQKTEDSKKQESDTQFPFSNLDMHLEE